MISNNGVGLASDNNDIGHLKNQLYSLVDQIKQDKEIKRRCLKLFESQYGVEKAVDQILDALGVSNTNNSRLPKERRTDILRQMCAHLLDQNLLGANIEVPKQLNEIDIRASYHIFFYIKPNFWACFSNVCGKA